MTAMDRAQFPGKFTPRREFLVAIDSDGTVFDNMGIKHRECFCPWIIGYFGLQPVAQAARECVDFADLYSRTRGANRHKSLVHILMDLLPSHPAVKARGFEVPRFPHYFAWVDDPNSVLSGEGLEQAVAESSGPARKELELVLDWNRRVDWAVEQIVRGIPPFPLVQARLEKMQGRADVVVISTAPGETLARDWTEQGLAGTVAMMAGQEMGTKTRVLESATKGRYDRGHVLMIGDAPGDREAAQANDALFYPILPDDEVASWQRFHDEAMDRFFNGMYAGRYEEELIREFDARLPEKPPWIK
jgi:phosphoglycolate phosphatase-like HAD superfamily hydrolase